jgi:hypothetical protein
MAMVTGGWRQWRVASNGEGWRRPKATSMTIGAAAAANDGDSGRQRAATATAGGNGRRRRCSGVIPSAIVAEVGRPCRSSSYDDEALRKPTEVYTVGIHR